MERPAVGVAHCGLDFKFGTLCREAVVYIVGMAAVRRSQHFIRPVLFSSIQAVLLKAVGHGIVYRTAATSGIPDPDIESGIVGGASTESRQGEGLESSGDIPASGIGEALKEVDQPGAGDASGVWVPGTIVISHNVFGIRSIPNEVIWRYIAAQLHKIHSIDRGRSPPTHGVGVSDSRADA